MEFLHGATEIFFHLYTLTICVTVTLARCANVTRLVHQTVPVFTRNLHWGSKDFSYMRSIDLCNNMRQVKQLSHHDKEGGWSKRKSLDGDRYSVMSDDQSTRTAGCSCKHDIFCRLPAHVTRQ